MRQANLNTNNGFTLVEVMIAIVVLAIGLLGAASMQLSSTKGNANASQMTEATNLALDQIETILSWDFDDARLADTNAVNFQRMGISAGNTTIRTIDDTADNSATFEGYTVYWDGTPHMDPGNLTQQVGMDLEVYVVWTEGTRLKTVTMNVTKVR